MSTAALFDAIQTSRQNTGIVDDQTVTGTQMFLNIKKMFVADLTGLSVQITCRLICQKNGRMTVKCSAY